MSVLFASLLVSSFSPAADQPALSEQSLAAMNWVDLSRRLTGESEATRQRVLRRLRALPDLTELLRQGLKTSDRALALDAVAALQLNDFLPELLSEVKDDPDGSTTLTVNTLLSHANSQQIISVYDRLLDSPALSSLSASAVVAMLDPLGRLGAPLSKALFGQLLNHSSFEIRAAALYYLRLLLLRHRRSEYQPWLVQALKSRPYQIRLQALAILGELKLPREKRNSFLTECLQDTNSAVRLSCQSLAREETSK